MKIENIEKLATNLHNKNEYVIYIRNLKEALNHGLVLKKFTKSLSLIKHRNKHSTNKKRERWFLERPFQVVDQLSFPKKSKENIRKY